ncbi:MAG: HAMP domain-containing sensor histidine kinase [Victivallales bacterium]|nr:HAMP domain-containing sensor histidine kinase [Victivallales bacterium]
MIIDKNVKTEFAAPERLNHDWAVKQYRELISAKDLHVFYDYTPDLIMVLNEYRQIIFANKTLLTFLKKNDINEVIGLRPGEALRCKEAFKNPAGCGTAKSCRACGTAKAIIHTGNAQEKTGEFYVQTVDKGKSYNFRLWTSHPWKDKNYTLFVIRDIADEKLRNSLEQTFFHDLINTACDLEGIIRLINSYSAFTQHLPLLRGLSHVILEEINAQRDLRYAEEGTINIHKSPVDALGLITKAAKIYQVQKISRNIKINIAADSEDISFISDERLLVRIIENLLKNAIEASTPGQTVTLGCRKDGRNVLFSVHNRSYMEENVQDNVFKRSFSTKTTGRGWGTYGVKLLTEKYLGGKVSFTSSPEAGTTFYVSYPLD